MVLTCSNTRNSKYLGSVCLAFMLKLVLTFSEEYILFQKRNTFFYKHLIPFSDKSQKWNIGFEQRLYVSTIDVNATGRSLNMVYVLLMHQSQPNLSAGHRMNHITKYLSWNFNTSLDYSIGYRSGDMDGQALKSEMFN